ncbi:hypothetical protein SISNIDRAFT_463360 [Sistotremastrum niveocremeum HHB9708]|uniref:F-box domain-containing protein n=1 Tax=Sistotremastrum niveocremeum HHB9708 TaxID=1314777 RepID=A0A164Z2H4_9AGAM|nr:hypothetical protein SISNIDRAFT_463360 [Sistotremastrum niveocremeum HHB9708]
MLNIRRGEHQENSEECQPVSSTWRGILDILPSLKMITAERNVPMENFFRVLRDEANEEEDYSSTLLGVIDINGAKGDKHRWPALRVHSSLSFFIALDNPDSRLAPALQPHRRFSASPRGPLAISELRSKQDMGHVIYSLIPVDVAHPESFDSSFLNGLHSHIVPSQQELNRSKINFYSSKNAPFSVGKVLKQQQTTEMAGFDPRWHIMRITIIVRSEEENEARTSDEMNSQINGRSASLPSDILHLIFEWRHRDIFERPGYGFKSEKDFCKLFSLTHICSKWRAIAIDDSLLWNTILLTWPIPIIEIFIERAQSVGLRMFLVLSAGSDGPLATSDLPALGTLIARHMPNMRELKLTLWGTENDPDGWNDHFVKFCLSFMHLEAPELRKFAVRIGSEGTDLRYHVIRNLFSGNAPSLIQLELDNAKTLLIGTRFPSLVELELDIGNRSSNGPIYLLRDLPVLLSQFPRLETLRLGLHQSRHDFDIGDLQAFYDAAHPSTHVVLPCCKSICLDYMRTHHIDYILRYIEAPSIQKLSLVPISSKDRVDTLILPRFSSWIHPLIEDVPMLDFAVNGAHLTLEITNQRTGGPLSVDLNIIHVISSNAYERESSRERVVEEFTTNFALLNPVIIRLFEHEQTIFFPLELSVNAWQSILASCTRLNKLIFDRNAPLDNFFDVYRDDTLIVFKSVPPYVASLS